MKTNLLSVKHSEFVLSRLNKQRIKGLFCDAILIVEGEQFKVHKSFLAANSDYFLALFSSAKEQENFVLAGVPLEGFKVLLDFIYTSSFVLNSLNVHDVYKASTALGFSHVKNASEKVYRQINRMSRSRSCCNLNHPNVKKHTLRETNSDDEKAVDFTKTKTKENTQDIEITSSTRKDYSKTEEKNCSVVKRIKKEDDQLSVPQDLSVSNKTHTRETEIGGSLPEDKDIKNEEKICADDSKSDVYPIDRPFVDITRKNNPSKGLKRKAIDDVLVLINSKDSKRISAVNSSNICKTVINVD